MHLVSHGVGILSIAFSWALGSGLHTRSCTLWWLGQCPQALLLLYVKDLRKKLLGWMWVIFLINRVWSFKMCINKVAKFPMVTWYHHYHWLSLLFDLCKSQACVGISRCLTAFRNQHLTPCFPRCCGNSSSRSRGGLVALSQALEPTGWALHAVQPCCCLRSRSANAWRLVSAACFLLYEYIYELYSFFFQ